MPRDTGSQPQPVQPGAHRQAGGAARTLVEGYDLNRDAALLKKPDQRPVLREDDMGLNLMERGDEPDEGDLSPGEVRAVIEVQDPQPVARPRWWLGRGYWEYAGSSRPATSERSPIRSPLASTSRASSTIL